LTGPARDLRHLAIPILVQQWRRMRGGQDDIEPNQFVALFGGVYLVVLAILWAGALPQYFSAVDGFTREETPVGSLLYAAVCFAAAALCLAAAVTATGQRNFAMISSATT
jgi:hypothetical protein